jgi:DDE superfamily endonuclease
LATAGNQALPRITTPKPEKSVVSLHSRGGTRHKVLLIIDNLRIHQARLVTDWAQANRHRIELFYLPRRRCTDTLDIA